MARIINSRESFAAERDEILAKIAEAEKEFTAIESNGDAFKNRAAYYRGLARLAGRLYTQRNNLANLFEGYSNYWKDEPVPEAKVTAAGPTFEDLKGTASAKELAAKANDDLFGPKHVASEEPDPFAELRKMDEELAKLQTKKAPKPEAVRTQANVFYLHTDDVRRGGPEIVPVMMFVDKLGSMLRTHTKNVSSTGEMVVQFESIKTMEEMARIIRESEFYGKMHVGKVQPADWPTR